MVLAIKNLHAALMPPIKFWLNLTYTQGHLRYRNKTILLILNLYVTPVPPIKFELNPHYGLGGNVIWRISRWLPGGQPSWCRNGTNLAGLNLHVSPMPPTMFQLNPTWRPSSILERKESSNSKSPYHPNASHQVLAQSDLPFGSKCVLKIFKMATVAAILDIGTERF